MNKYEYQFVVACPNDPDEFIDYALCIEHPKLIFVESIVAACDFKQPAYHEDIAGALAERLPGEQTIKATHKGVAITTSRAGVDEDHA